MKRCIAAFAFLLSCAAAVYPQDTGPAPDYGVQVNIDAEYETSLDLSYREDPNTVTGIQTSLRALAFPIWSPEGDRIFFTDQYNIYSISAAGGKPTLLYEGIFLYPHNGRRYILPQPVVLLGGISPDGRKLYFIQILMEEAQVTVTEHIDQDGNLSSWGYSLEHLPTDAYALRCLDLETGTATTLARDVGKCVLSRSGKYLVYYGQSTKTVRVRDMEAGEEWSLPISSYSAVFTDNDQNILYSVTSDSTGTFYRIPVRGGEPQPVAVLAAITEKLSIPPSLDCKPEGGWAIYCLDTGETCKETSFTKAVQILRLSNIQTGQTMEVVPFSRINDVYWPQFSPDGKQICFIRNDWEKNEYALYTKDISSFLNAEIPVSVADEAPKGFALTGNYPNPFNPSTTISFTLPSSGAARLSIYDVTGRTVRTLASPPLSAGRHEMVWDGRDDSGKAVSSGTYIARLKMGNFTASHRMTLMK